MDIVPVSAETRTHIRLTYKSTARAPWTDLRYEIETSFLIVAMSKITQNWATTAALARNIFFRA